MRRRANALDGGANAQQADKLLDKGRRLNFERLAARRRALQQWGRTSIITHLDDDEYHWLREAVRRAPRNGYEMTRELPAATLLDFQLERQTARPPP